MKNKEKKYKFYVEVYGNRDGTWTSVVYDLDWNYVTEFTRRGTRNAAYKAAQRYREKNS